MVKRIKKLGPFEAVKYLKGDSMDYIVQFRVVALHCAISGDETSSVAI